MSHRIGLSFDNDPKVHSGQIVGIHDDWRGDKVNILVPYAKLTISFPDFFLLFLRTEAQTYCRL
jgi:hypothetical protein